MRNIRVKQENQQLIIEALQKAGFVAQPSRTPLSEWEHERNSFSDFSDQTFKTLVGMAGVETTASGHQAHKIISALKAEGVIE